MRSLTLLALLVASPAALGQAFFPSPGATYARILTTSPDSGQREYAAKMLGQTGDLQYLASLSWAAANDRSSRVRRAASQAAASLSQPPVAFPYRQSFPSPALPVPASLPAGDEAFVRSLYVRYLGREPDPQGFHTWTRRLYDIGGNRDLLVREFLQAAQPEVITNSPPYRYGGYR